MNSSSNEVPNSEAGGWSVPASNQPDAFTPGISVVAQSPSWSWLDQFAAEDAEGGSGDDLLLFAERLLHDKETADLRLRILETEQQLTAQAESLKRSVTELHRANLQKAEAESRAREIQQELETLKERVVDLRRQKDLAHLLGRVCKKADERLMHDSAFAKRFEETSPCEAFILVLDIRRSTELMLRATSSQAYAYFLDGMMKSLVETIKQHFGVIDKFTGDGLLAYFPSFYSGKDAGFYTLAAAERCHANFSEYYRDNRDKFTVTSAEAGVGIGIDYGKIQLLRITDELTVLGSPVVYATRLSAAPAGHTYMNHGGILELKRQRVPMKQSEIEVQTKLDGKIIAFDVGLDELPFNPIQPDWISPSASAGAEQQTKTGNIVDTTTDLKKC
jgi:class 3 adenylate cyclase